MVTDRRILDLARRLRLREITVDAIPSPFDRALVQEVLLDDWLERRIIKRNRRAEDRPPRSGPKGT